MYRRRVFKVKIIMLFINIRFISRRVTNRIVYVTICRPGPRRRKSNWKNNLIIVISEKKNGVWVGRSSRPGGVSGSGVASVATVLYSKNTTR